MSLQSPLHAQPQFDSTQPVPFQYQEVIGQHDETAKETFLGLQLGPNGDHAPHPEIMRQAMAAKASLTRRGVDDGRDRGNSVAAVTVRPTARNQVLSRT